MRNFLAPAVLVLFFSFALAALVSGRQEEARGSKTNDNAPPPKTITSCPATGKTSLYYEFGWNGIPAAKATVKIRQAVFDQKPAIRLLANAKTIGLARKLWKMNDRVEALVHPETLKPLQVNIHRDEGGKVYRTNISYLPETCKAKVVNVKDSGKVEKKEFECGDAYDPLTLLLVVRCLDLRVGKTIFFDVLEGDDLYRVFLDVKKKERIKVKAGTYNAFMVTPTFRKLPLKIDDDGDESKVDKVSIWVADLPEKYLLKIKSKVFVGHIYGELTDID